MTGESRTKLAQAKSRGLVRTLISEALTSQKTSEEIKDSLHLKISNADIHTSISCFMDIQQSDKEFLAAYVHQFKWEASRCKFDNDTATIRIFLKGLKNAHTLATKIYEKGPQSLEDTIKEVVTLQAAQQITSTLLPSLLVNTMSSENDKCFQCQETGHMAHYCPHIRCIDCNNYGHITVDCPDKIPPSACQHGTEITPLVDVTGQHLRTATPDILTVTIGTYTDSADHILAHITQDIGVTAIMIPTEAILDHFINLHAIAPCITEVPAHTTIAVTHHITDPPHTDIPPEKTVDPEHIDPAGNSINPHTDHLPVHSQYPGSLRTECTNRSQLTIHPQNIIAQMNRIVTQRMI